MSKSETFGVAFAVCALLAAATLFANPFASATDGRAYASTSTTGPLKSCPEYFYEADDCGDLAGQDIRSELKLHGKTLSVVVADYEILGRFDSLIEASGLSSKINAGGPFTIFAPTNDAVIAANLKSFEATSEAGRRMQLRQLVASHIVPGEINWEQLAGRKSVLITLSGSRIVVDGNKGLRIGEAKITDSDVLAANGIVHIVDAVIAGGNDNAPGA